MEDRNAFVPPHSLFPKNHNGDADYQRPAKKLKIDGKESSRAADSTLLAENPADIRERHSLVNKWANEDGRGWSDNARKALARQSSNLAWTPTDDDLPVAKINLENIKSTFTPLNLTYKELETFAHLEIIDHKPAFLRHDRYLYSMIDWPQLAVPSLSENQPFDFECEPGRMVRIDPRLQRMSHVDRQSITAGEWNQFRDTAKQLVRTALPKEIQHRIKALIDEWDPRTIPATFRVWAIVKRADVPISIIEYETLRCIKWGVFPKELESRIRPSKKSKAGPGRACKSEDRSYFADVNVHFTSSQSDTVSPDLDHHPVSDLEVSTRTVAAAKIIRYINQNDGRMPPFPLHGTDASAKPRGRRAHETPEQESATVEMGASVRANIADATSCLDRTQASKATLPTRASEIEAGQIDQLTKKVSQIIDQAKKELGEAVAQSKQGFSDAIGQSQQGLITVAQRFEAYHDRTIGDWSRQMDETRRAFVADVTTMTERHKRSIDALKYELNQTVSGHNIAIATMEKQHMKAMDELRADHAIALAKMKSDHEKAIGDSKKVQSRFIKNLQDAQDKTFLESEARHQAAVQDAVQDAMQDADERHQRAIATLKVMRDNSTKMYEAQLKSANDNVQKLEQQLAQAWGVIQKTD